MKNLTISQKISIIIVLLIWISLEIYHLTVTSDQFNNKQTTIKQAQTNQTNNEIPINNDPNLKTFIGKKLLVKGKCKLKSKQGENAITRSHLIFESIEFSENGNHIFKLKDKKGLEYWCPNQSVELFL